MFYLFILETELANYTTPVPYSKEPYTPSDLKRMNYRHYDGRTPFSDCEDVEFLVDGLSHLKLRAIKADSYELALEKYN